MIQDPFPIPKPLWIGFNIIYSCRSAWYWHKKGDHLKNYFLASLAGSIIGNKIPEPLAVSVAFFSHAIDCLEEKRELSRLCYQLKRAANAPIFGDPPPNWSPNPIFHFILGPYLAWRLSHSFQATVEKIKKVTSTSFSILKSLFQLSMHLTDTLETLSHKKEAQDEFFIHASKLVNKKICLIEAVTRDDPIAEKLFSSDFSLKKSQEQRQVIEIIEKCEQISRMLCVDEVKHQEGDLEEKAPPQIVPVVASTLRDFASGLYHTFIP